METETAIKIVDKVFQIGESPKHYASVDFSTNKHTFAAAVHIHEKDNHGLSAGLADTRYFNNESSYIMHSDWLNGWISRIGSERESN